MQKLFCRFFVLQIFLYIFNSKKNSQVFASNSEFYLSAHHQLFSRPMSSEYFVLLIIETAKMKEHNLPFHRQIHESPIKRVSHIKHFDLVARYSGSTMLCNC